MCEYLPIGTAIATCVADRFAGPISPVALMCCQTLVSVASIGTIDKLDNN